jgi:ubiquinone/menaquinone biosynthesis C-methylase UbiE
VTERVDFSSNAPIYDWRHGAILAPEVARALAALAALESGSRVLDIGAGTGRVATALASVGCHVVALEPAVKMLGELRRKGAGQAVRVVAGEGARLPFPRGCFDAVVVARVLYVMVDAYLEHLEVIRSAVLPGGPGPSLTLRQFVDRIASGEFSSCQQSAMSVTTCGWLRPS